MKSPSIPWQSKDLQKTAGPVRKHESSSSQSAILNDCSLASGNFKDLQVLAPKCLQSESEIWMLQRSRD